MPVVAAKNSQFQQRAVGVAVGIFLVALLLEVVLQGADGLGVVSLEAADDVGDVLRTLGRILAVHLVWPGGKGTCGIE